MADDDLFEEDLEDEEEDFIDETYLVFLIGERHFALQVAQVIEIVRLQPITEVPEMPDFVKGVINLRGRIIPVFDMRLRFQLTEEEYGERTCIVIAEEKDRTIGLIVDAVREVERISEEDICAAPRFEGDASSRFIKAIGKVGDDVRIILNAEDLLTTDEKVDLNRLEAAIGS